MRKMKNTLFLTLAVAVLLILCACGGDATEAPAPTEVSVETDEPIVETFTFSFSINDAAGSDFDYLVIQPLIKMMDEKSGGRIILDVYYSGSLWGMGKNLDAMKIGTLDMGCDILTMYPGQYLYAELFATPGLDLGGIEETGRVFSEYEKEFPEEGLEDFVVLSRYAAGDYGFISNGEPLTAPDSLIGKSMHAAPSLASWLEAMGAGVSSTPVWDVYERIRLAEIEGAIATLGEIYGYALYSISDYYVSLPMVNGDEIIAMSRELYDSLPADIQNVIDEVCEELPAICAEFRLKTRQNNMNRMGNSNAGFGFVEIEDAQGFFAAAEPLLQAKAEELDAAGLDGTAALIWLRERSK